MRSTWGSQATPLARHAVRRPASTHTYALDKKKTARQFSAEPLKPETAELAAEPEPWGTIIGGGILSFGGLWWLAGLEQEDNKKLEEEERLGRGDADYDGPAKIKPKQTSWFKAF